MPSPYGVVSRTADCRRIIQRYDWPRLLSPYAIRCDDSPSRYQHIAEMRPVSLCARRRRNVLASTWDFLRRLPRRAMFISSRSVSVSSDHHWSPSCYFCRRTGCWQKRLSRLSMARVPRCEYAYFDRVSQSNTRQKRGRYAPSLSRAYRFTSRRHAILDTLHVRYLLLL